MEAENKRCKNPGCNQNYIESENTDQSCHYHPGKVIFHDTIKGWQCCDQKAFDWEGFEKLVGCAVGRHSDVQQQTDFYQSSTVSNAERAIQNQSENAPVIRSIDDFEKEEEERLRRLRQSEVLEPMIDSEGLYTCGNFGCTKKFDINNNVEGDCHYHAGAPGFRDVCKYWTCCNVQAWDWDDFQKLPTCAVGVHKPKMVKRTR